MNLLVIDQDRCGIGLNYCIRCRDAGHNVRYWLPRFPGGVRNWIGDGLIEKVEDWQEWMKWADMIVLTDNAHYHEELGRFFKKGYPIFGTSPEAAQVELDREWGQQVLKKYGIKTIPYQTFHSYDKAIKFVEETGKGYVSKPLGDADKGYSYVSNGPDDLVCKLEHWKEVNAVKNGFILQEKIEGVEMAVGGWFGPGGWSQWKNENWEEKRLMNDGLGINTGEQGTTLRYVKESKLFDDTLAPCTDYLASIGYVGYVDMNSIVVKGEPCPLEWTIRLGTPHFNISMMLHHGDPAEWMFDLMKGKDSLRCGTQTAVGVVWSHGKYPYEEPRPEDCGYPVYGIGEANEDSIAFMSMMNGVAPLWLGRKMARVDMPVTAGNMALVCMGVGSSVRKAAALATDIAWELTLPSNRMFRTDIGMRLQGELEELQKHGYAEGMKF